jgi:hypothetical protein
MEMESTEKGIFNSKTNKTVSLTHRIKCIEINLGRLCYYFRCCLSFIDPSTNTEISSVQKKNQQEFVAHKALCKL